MSAKRAIKYCILFILSICLIGVTRWAHDELGVPVSILDLLVAPGFLLLAYLIFYVITLYWRRPPAAGMSGGKAILVSSIFLLGVLPLGAWVLWVGLRNLGHIPALDCAFHGYTIAMFGSMATILGLVTPYEAFRSWRA